MEGVEDADMGSDGGTHSEEPPTSVHGGGRNGAGGAEVAEMGGMPVDGDAGDDGDDAEGDAGKRRGRGGAIQKLWGFRGRSRPPDYGRLAAIYPEFAPFVGADGVVKWTDPEALHAVTKVLLTHGWDLDWDLPEGNLCPTVTLRANYIKWIASLLEMFNDGVLGGGVAVPLGVDIGTGASCIYPLMGHRAGGWRFVATEVDEESVAWAKQLVARNHLGDFVDVRHVKRDSFLVGNLHASELDGDGAVAFCMCNPPFFDSLDETNGNPKTADTGTPSELVYPGGELAFVKGIVNDSCRLRKRVGWYTTMLGRKTSIQALVRQLRFLGVTALQTTEFFQGKVTRWGLAWSFLPLLQFDEAKLAACDPGDVFLTHKERQAKQRAASFIVEGVDTAEALVRTEEYLAGLKTVHWDQVSSAHASAMHEAVERAAPSVFAAATSYNITATAPYSVGTKSKPKKERAKRGVATKRRHRSLSDDDVDDGESFGDAHKRVRGDGSVARVGSSAAAAAENTFSVRITIEPISGILGGSRVEISLLYSLGDARTHFWRLCSQLQADVVRTGRKWRRRIQAKRAPSAAGAVGPRLTGAPDDDADALD